MATEWKVEGKGAETRIKANCPACKSGEKFHNVPAEEFVHLRFKHGGCKGLVETIPTEIRDLYWERAVVSRC
jgi:hypothetical protein